MLRKIIQQLEKAYNKLNEAIRKEDELLFKNEHSILRDSIIQRFEFTFELYWKALKEYFYKNGIICYSPRECIKEALKAGITNDEDKWLEILKAKNLTSHTYNEEMAEEIYQLIKKSYKIFESAINVIKEKDMEAD